MFGKRLNPELDATKRQLSRLADQIAALEQELAWMTDQRNKLHNIVQHAREGFEVMHAALYPNQHFEINVDWENSHE